ncbi:MAG TPA: hypothetical protein VFR81_25850 [Longimicrobium sp.]|nr:hypothetical protein [Longimicrobium sp.]
MNHSIRQQIARGLAAAAALTWALAWGAPALWSLASGVDLYQQTTALGEWLHGLVPLRENTFACLRDLAVAAVPGAALLALDRRGEAGMGSPRAWRPVPLLLALLAIVAAQSALLTGAIRFDLWSPGYALLLDGVPAAMAAAALAVLLRRLGPVREWTGGALLAVGTLVVGVVAPVTSGMTMAWLFFGPRPLAARPALAFSQLHWVLALGLAALACRWVATRPGPKARAAYPLAVLGGFAFPVLLMMSPGQVYLLPAMLLAMTAAGQQLWSWSERETPPVHVALQGG